jgi:hypothetical protein
MSRRSCSCQPRHPPPSLLPYHCHGSFRLLAFARRRILTFPFPSPVRVRRVASRMQFSPCTCSLSDAPPHCLPSPCNSSLRQIHQNDMLRSFAFPLLGAINASVEVRRRGGGRSKGDFEPSRHPPSRHPCISRARPQLSLSRPGASPPASGLVAPLARARRVHAPVAVVSPANSFLSHE